MNGQSKQRISYAIGAFGHDIFYATLSTYFMVFVTSAMFTGADKETTGKMIGIITGLVVAIRLVEIIFDPIIGGVIDNTKTKYGKFKPWLVIGGVVSSILLVCIFTNFFGLAINNTTLFIILFAIVYILLDSFYSFKDIAFWSMIPALSTDTKEREKLATFARIGSSLGANGTTLAVVPIVTFFTFLMTGKDSQGASGWFWFGLIAAVIAGGTAIVTALGTKENDSVIRQQQEKAGIKDIFKAITKNDQLMWLALSYIAYAIANVATTGVLFFFFKYILGNSGEFWIVGLIAAITGLIAVPLFPALTKLISRRFVYIGGIVMMLLAYGCFLLAGTSLPVVIVGLVLYYFPQQLMFLSALMTITDAVEYGQWKNGTRNEAVTLSIRPLLDKIAGALSNGIVGFVAVAAGMTGNTTAADITAQGVSTFHMYAFYLPAALMIFSAIIFAWKITLTEKKHAQIVKELEARLNHDEKTWREIN
ncbi:sodium:solute symporter [Bacillus mycoides]|uniref:Sodium:solute symporter n=1 Tax=Bacillus mycoides TaxID=1405 RepID=A0A120EIK4_BACMY|nr:glycoside-pentoside-hexuronide (GPH):cation symporter [Bacillus mycoides]KWU65518.1 sodium:solute symporter [Bacillus mycoides]